jgi:predicted Fe-Mo cluster-binding NifX family protein
MKIAVASTGPTLDDLVEARFGRCAYFVIVDPDTLEFESFPNPNIALGGGAGPQSAQLMANKDVSAVLTGNCGPNAFRTFGAARIQVITGVSGQVRQAVEQLKSGALRGDSAPSVQGHFGRGTGSAMGGGRGKGLGMGGGYAMGKGGGRGMGAGRNFSGGSGSGRPESNPQWGEEELERLKDRARDLGSQIKDIESRIRALEKERNRI